jgi:hypothetical protein
LRACCRYLLKVLKLSLSLSLSLSLCLCCCRYYLKGVASSGSLNGVMLADGSSEVP